MENFNSKNNSVKKFNSLKELGTKSSVREYLKLSGMENPPEIKITAVPMIHAFEENFLKLKEILDKRKIDIFLFENATSFEGVWELIKGLPEKNVSKEEIIKNAINENEDFKFEMMMQTFAKPLLTYIEERNIVLDSFEEKYESQFQAGEQSEKMLNHLRKLKSTDLRKEYDSLDINKAFETIKIKSSNFFDIWVKNRDEKFLSNLSKNVKDLILKNKFLQNKKELNISFFVGLMHEKGFVNKLIERDEEIEVIKPNELEITSDNGEKQILYSFIIGIFFEYFKKDFNLDLNKYSENIINLSKKYNFNILEELGYKNPEDYLSFILKAKDQKEMNPENYLLKELEEFAKNKREYFNKNNIKREF